MEHYRIKSRCRRNRKGALLFIAAALLLLAFHHAAH